MYTAAIIYGMILVLVVAMASVTEGYVSTSKLARSPVRLGNYSRGPTFVPTSTLYGGTGMSDYAQKRCGSCRSKAGFYGKPVHIDYTPLSNARYQNERCG